MLEICARCERHSAVVQVGVAEGRLRKWLLSIAAFLRNQNGSILDAMHLWKANVDQAFQVRCIALCVLNKFRADL